MTIIVIIWTDGWMGRKTDGQTSVLVEVWTTIMFDGYLKLVVWVSGCTITLSFAHVVCHGSIVQRVSFARPG